MYKCERGTLSSLMPTLPIYQMPIAHVSTRIVDLSPIFASPSGFRHG